MSKYLEIIKRVELLDAAAQRCASRGQQDMADMWAAKAEALHDKALDLTIEEAQS